jgi:hypothetical protein
MPLVDAAAQSGQETGQDFPRVMVFNLFGQGTAFFQSAQTLTEGYQPVEALLPLRGLVVTAARFEQMMQPDGAGLGLAVRLAADALEREYINPVPQAGITPQTRDRATAGRDEWLAAAANAGLMVPDEVKPPEQTTIWQSLGAEMRLARQVADVSYTVVGLHVKPGDAADQAGFETKLEPGPFTDLVASACVIAQLELLKHAAAIFGWNVDATRIESLLSEARDLNQTSATSPGT